MTTPANLQFLRSLVRDRSAIVLNEDKDYLLETRLSSVAKDAGLATLDALVQRLRAGNARLLETTVIEAVTTNETYFFRDAHPFETLRTTVLPELIDRRSKERSLRIWCGASSSGQEPYTVAMLLRDLIPTIDTWNFEFIATDINESVVEQARQGIYKKHEVERGLPADMLSRHFDRNGTGWQVKADIRRLVTYKTLNLKSHWPLHGMFDLVFIRNVLIYFDVKDKHDILDRAKRLLAPDGALFLGGAETTVNLHEGYQPVQCGRTTYYKHR